MRQIIKYAKTLAVLILLGIVTGIAVRSQAMLSQKNSARVTSASIHPSVTVMAENPARTRILFTGDINLGRCIAKRTLSAHAYTNNYDYPFQFVADDLRSADITVGSLDGSLSDISAPMDCPHSMNLIAPTRMVEGLQFAGFDVMTIATNHIKDCGNEGFECENKALFDTIHTLAAAGIQAVGSGKSLSEARAPIIIERNGIRFAFLGVDQIEERVWATDNVPGAAPLSQKHIEDIKADIISAKKIADVVIVLPHWGVEYAAAPDKVQRVWAQEFIHAGAALVVGNHPHIIQPMEFFSDKIVFYALGNFVFDQEQSFRRESVVVEVNFIGNQIESWQLRPVSINYYTFQSHWAKAAEADYILARASKNAP